MSKCAKLFFIIVLPIMLGGCAASKPQANTAVDSFPKEKIEGLAKALTADGAKVYGSQYCSACKIQKVMFGSAWQYINFVECSINASEIQNASCRAEGIRLYPTWEFSDGSRLEGVQPLETLAKKINFAFP